MQPNNLDISFTAKTQLKKKLYVEGKDNVGKVGLDRRVIEKFLDHVYPLWKEDLEVMSHDNADKIIRTLESSQDTNIWGLIDRDARTIAEIRDLQTRAPNLLVLPRWTIENYFIVPIELNKMLPPNVLSLVNLADIDIAKNQWITQGALWQVLYEQGAFQFCRGNESGYPMAILGQPVISNSDVEKRLNDWRNQLDSGFVLSQYDAKIRDFRSKPNETYFYQIHGKKFFNQVVLTVLNKASQKAAETWFDDLIDSITDCPPDLVPVLQRLF